ncbi:MAG: hypothetical protein HQM08_10595 [Candidatus Riflebacteria bacterium]|nr:hypothetical protein [Candidatus Riflebacteria bacterium]
MESDGNNIISEQKAAAKIEKIKAIFALGVGANFFTLIGTIAIWIVLVKTEWVFGFWRRLFFAFAFMPVFMADAIHSYVLNRIKIDEIKGFNDVLISEEGKGKLRNFHNFWRFLSFFTASFLALTLITTLSPTPEFWNWAKIFFAALFTVYFTVSRVFFHRYFAPVLPDVSSKSLKRKNWMFICFSLPWVIWLLIRDPLPMSAIGCMFHGIIFFLLASSLHPLPTKFSLLWRERKNGTEFSTPKTMEVEVSDIIEIPETISAESEIWTTQHGFRKISKVKLPLFELPIFFTVGEALLSNDSLSLLLITQSEIKKNFHRALVSKVDGIFFLSSDFGTSEAKFPGEVKYNFQKPEITSVEFLESHQKFLNTSVEPFPQSPWESLKILNEKILCFLRSDARTFFDKLGFKQ